MVYKSSLVLLWLLTVYKVLVTSGVDIVPAVAERLGLRGIWISVLPNNLILAAPSTKLQGIDATFQNNRSFDF